MSLEEERERLKAWQDSMLGLPKSPAVGDASEVLDYETPDADTRKNPIGETTSDDGHEDNHGVGGAVPVTNRVKHDLGYK